MSIEGGNLKSIFRNESKDIFVAVAALFSVNFVASVVLLFKHYLSRQKS